MTKPDFWEKFVAVFSDKKFQALVENAKSAEELEGGVLEHQIALKNENETLKNQLAEADAKYKALQAELDKLKAQASEVETLRAQVEQLSALPAANSVADKVKGGFTPSAEGGEAMASWDKEWYEKNKK